MGIFFNLHLNSWNNNYWSCLSFYCLYSLHRELPRWLSGTESACNAGNARDMGFRPFIGKIPWRRKWHPLQHSCLENPMDRGAWRAIVHGFAESDVTEHADIFHSSMGFIKQCIFHLRLQKLLFEEKPLMVFWSEWYLTYTWFLVRVVCRS